MFHLKLLTNLLSGYVVLSIFSIWGNWFRQSSNIEIPSLEYTSCGFLNDWGKISILRPKLILSLGVYPWWRRQWHPTPVLLPGKSHGRRSLVGCGPSGREKSDTTEQLHFHFSLSLFTFMHWRRKWQPTPVFLPGESQGQGSLVGCRLGGRTESDTTDVT